MQIEKMDNVLLTSENHEFGHVPGKKALAQATALAAEEGVAITITHPISAKALKTVQPPKKAAAKGNGKGKANGKGKPAPKVVAAPKAAAVAPKKVKSPKGMVIKILALASRPKGVTPAELNKLTTWKGAPWKWLFQNPKKNGYCDRWGYKFEVLTLDKEDARAVSYKVTKK